MEVGDRKSCYFVELKGTGARIPNIRINQNFLFNKLVFNWRNYLKLR